MSINVLEQQVIELQTRLAFQEDSIHQLSDQLARQAADLRIAQLHIQTLNQKLNELLHSSEGGAPAADERPPHY